MYVIKKKLVEIMKFFSNLQAEKTGFTILGKSGLLWNGLTTIALGAIQFIPNNSSIPYAAAGFAIRISQAIGSSALIFTAYVALSKAFVEERTLVLVSF